MSVIQYRFSNFSEDFNITLQIDTDILKKPEVLERLATYCSYESWIEEQDNNPFQAFCWLAARKIINNYQTNWNEEALLKNEDGFCIEKLDGSEGLKLVSFEEPDFELICTKKIIKA